MFTVFKKRAHPNKEALMNAMKYLRVRKDTPSLEFTEAEDDL